MGPSDRFLIWRLRRRDHEACRELIRRHHGRVFRYLVHLGADRATADDLTQETYARAWSHIGSLREAASLRSWLLAIARNEFLQKVRARRPNEVALDDAASVPARQTAVDEALEQSERQARLRGAVDGLEGPLREAIALHYFQDLSLREVGAVVGVPVGTIKSRLNRALQELRARLQKEADHA